jgi:hypothetical protein
MFFPLLSTKKLSITAKAPSKKKLNVHQNFIIFCILKQVTKNGFARHNVVTGRSGMGGLQMFTEWQRMPIVVIQRVDKATRCADKSQCKRRNNRRKLLMEPSILVAA